MDAMMKCEICSREFNQSERLPKIMPCCGTTFCLDCITNVLPRPSEAELDQSAAQDALCKKCASCNHLVMMADGESGLLTNSQIVKMLKLMQNPFAHGSVEAKASQ